MSRHICRWGFLVALTLFLVGLTGLTLPVASAASSEYRPASAWRSPIRLSDSPTDPEAPPQDAWFPDIVVDSQRRVHVVWCQTTYFSDMDKSLPERLFYAVGSDWQWSQPNDIIPPARTIIRQAIDVDGTDRLHVLYRDQIFGLGETGIYHMLAPAEEAWSATAWSAPRLVSVRGRSYAADLAIDDEGVIHAVFDDTGDAESEVCPACADVYYRRSVDGGLTWSSPKNLGPSPMGGSRVQMALGADSSIHVTWDEGWDRLSGRGDPLYSVYVSSLDGGLTWRRPMTISQPVSRTVQLTAGVDDRRGVMLVWRVVTRGYDGLYYQWSNDHSRRWSRPEPIPGIFARVWSDPYDGYHMATDAAGHIHLLVVGRLSIENDASLGVYHLVWDGVSWSEPMEVFQRDDPPQYPRITVSGGNQLHATWFTRKKAGGVGGYHVWYSRSQSDAPYLPPPTAPTPTVSGSPEVASEVAIQPATVTPFPTLSSGGGGLPNDLYTEADEVLELAIGLGPIAAIVGIILLWRWWRRR